ncbi:unnamed protein product, partial [Scytosiphon promiscuus]
VIFYRHLTNASFSFLPLPHVSNPGYQLEDVDNVHLKLHPLVYTNKTWTPRKLLFRMRRDVILDVL